MKILKIELQNINSLKSETPISIDFEDPIFRDVGLYAITGATGAGKTTILDAITIALYQNVPRFNRSNIKAGLIDVVSYGAADALCRVTFSNKNTRYEAQWSIRLTGKNGKKLTKPDENVRLKNLNTEAIIAEKKTEFRIAIERITQLTYQQFLRSVMLAQGEFAAFLSANASEKGKLLEQITGEEIYKKIGEAIGARRTQETKTLDAIKSKINNEDLLSDTEKAGLQEEHQEIGTQVTALTPIATQVDNILEWYVKENALHKEKRHLETDVEALEKNKEAQKINLQLLAEHQKATPFTTQITVIKNAKQHLDEKKIHEQKAVKNQQLLSDQLAILKKQDQQSKETLFKKEKEHIEWLPKLETVTKLDAAIQNTTQQTSAISKGLEQRAKVITDLKKSIQKKQEQAEQFKEKISTLDKYLSTHQKNVLLEKELTDWNTQLTLRQNKTEQLQHLSKDILQKKEFLKQLIQTLAQQTEKIASENIRISNLTKTLKTIEIAIAENDLTAILSTQKELQNQQEILVNAHRTATQYSTDSKARKNLEAQKKTLFDQGIAWRADVNLLLPSIKQTTQALEDAEKILNLERTVKSFEEQRKNLVAKESCPLCGSKEHPYVASYKTIALSQSQKMVADRKSALVTLQEKAQGLEIKIAETKTSLKSNTTQLEDLTVKIQAYRSDFAILSTNKKIEDLADIEASLAKINEHLKSIAYKIKEAQELQKQKDTTSNTLISEKEKVVVLEKEIVTFDEKLKNNTQELQTKKTEQATITDALSSIERTLQEELAVYELQLPEIEKTTYFVKELETKISTYKGKEKQLERYKNELSQIRISIQNESKQWDEKTKENSKQQQEVALLSKELLQNTATRKQLLPIEITTVQKRNELQDTIEKTKKEAERSSISVQEAQQQQVASTKEKELVKKDIETLTDTINQHTAQLENSIKSTDFISIQAIENALLTHEEATKHMSILRALEDKNIALQTRKQQWETASLAQQQEKKFETSLEEANNQKQALDKTKNELLTKTGSIQQKIALDNQIRARNKTIITEISIQEKVVHTWKTLMELIGGSKDAFNTYVQRLTLQNLIHLANIHLYKLNKRYSLKMKETYKPGEELNFMLVDHYQADETRFVDTSSGGEKFLISLSLALGLSDLASHNVSIGSLFIDEGFGTLDTNTLETVIATLETLQAQGKMIGIISHVENLKERIATQIQVTKKNNGVSQVVVV